MKRRNLSLALLIALSTPAYAQVAPVCSQLRARLATLPEVIGSTPEVRKYAGALAEQNLELRKVRSDLRRNGCSSGSMVVIGGDNAGFCAELEQAETKMLDNISYLQQQRDELRAGSEDTRARNALIAALDENNCNAPIPQYDGQQEGDRPYDGPPSIDDQAMRNDTFIPLGGGSEGRRFYDGGPGGRTLSNVNTVCVRTCDGGFFPIRSNATSFDFARDASTCQQMCPGIETELFYHDVSQGETENMISASTGAPYSAMPNAFAYKNRKPGEKTSCSCDLPAYYRQMRRNQEVSAPPPKGSITSIETARPDTPAATPAPAPAPQAQAQVPDRPYDPAAGKVRQVGPQFLAGDQGTIDLKNPALQGAQPQQPQKQ